jgi:hypothetical protein
MDDVTQWTDGEVSPMFSMRFDMRAPEAGAPVS